MSGWKSRWSWLRFVKAATANRVPSTRRSSSACEETSIAHARSPPSSIARNVACRSIASGVVRTAGRSSPPTTVVTPPSRPRREPAGLEQMADEVGRGRLAARPGDPDHGERGRRVAVEGRRGAPHRGAHVGDQQLRHAQPQRPGDDERRGPAVDRVLGEVVPVAREAGHAEEERARHDRPVVVGEGGDLDVRPVAEQLAQRHQTASARSTTAAPSTPRGSVPKTRPAGVAQPAGAERVGHRRRGVADEQRALQRQREVLDRAAREPLGLGAAEPLQHAGQRVEMGVEPPVRAPAELALGEEGRAGRRARAPSPAARRARSRCPTPPRSRSAARRGAAAASATPPRSRCRRGTRAPRPRAASRACRSSTSSPRCRTGATACRPRRRRGPAGARPRWRPRTRRRDRRAR